MIETIVFVPQVGELYYGKVVRILQFGAFVELAPGKDGMVHISKLADRRVEKVEDVVNIGDMIWVKVTDIDDKGRVNLSYRDAIKLSVAIYSFTKTAAKTSTNRTAKTAKKTAGKAERKMLSATEKKEGLRKVIQQKLETAEKKGAEEKEKRTAKEAEAAKKPKEKKTVTAKKETKTE